MSHDDPTFIPTLDDPLAPPVAAPPAPANAYEAALAEGDALRRRPLVAGGVENIARQHAKHRMTVWERIDILSHDEPDVLFENWGPQLDGASLVTAILKIAGRDVAVYGHDFTVRAGSMDATNGRKLARLFHMAGEKGLPVIGLNDSAGAFGRPASAASTASPRPSRRCARSTASCRASSCVFGFNAGGGGYLPRQGSFVLSRPTPSSASPARAS
ncbi:MAG: carboxyl transferase domain-containing protein [Myxococcota bacterium]